MRTLALLRNPIRPYAWGSRTALAAFMGRPGPTPEPEAELWMGAHPSAPSEVLHAGRWRSLLDVIRESPEEVLGPGVFARFGAALPFLFKVLAVAKPLSIQAHPDAAQARAGFARENAAGIPIEAPGRSYRDPNPKPELVCALGEFRALKGFRSVLEVVELFETLAVAELEPALDALRADPPPEGLRAFVAGLLALDGEVKRRAISAALAAAREHETAHAAFRLLPEIAHHHPEDAGVLATLLLQPVTLRPGEALFLQPRELHCHLSGLAVELMANSDNVLRGGLTRKHVDRDELMRTLDFRSGDASPLHPQVAGSLERYRTPAAEFELSALRIEGHAPLLPEGARPVGSILLCAAGELAVRDSHAAELRLRRGDSALFPAAAGSGTVEGRGVLYRAAVPAE